jgi:hypothetical protein
MTVYAKTFTPQARKKEETSKHRIEGRQKQEKEKEGTKRTSAHLLKCCKIAQRVNKQQISLQSN